MPFFHDASHPDPPEVRNWRVHLLSISVSMGAAAMGYDTGVIGGTLALPSFRRDFGLDRASQHERDTLSGNIVSTFQAGYLAGTFFGSLLTFPLVEKYGRVRGMLAAGVVFLVGAVLMTASNGHLGMIYAGRGIAGLGIGSASLIIPVYIAEVSPPSIRGRLVGIFEILSQGGSMLGFWINYIVDRTVSSNTKTQWIIPLALQMLPGLFLLLGAAFAPESPRWLAKKDSWEKARKNLHYLRQLPLDSIYIEKELQGIRDQIEHEQLLAGEVGRSQWSGFKELSHKGTRNRVAIGLTLMMCQNMTGVNIITYYSPRIFETLGLTGTSTKLFATGFYGVAKTLGMIIFSVWLVERIGRRKGLIYGGLIGSLPMWYIGGYVFVADPATKAAAGQFTRNGWGYLAMVCVYLYGLIYCMTWQGITWVYCSEIFPIRIRMLCVALTTADQWLWSFIVSRTTPYMITSLGYGTYFFFASLMIVFGTWAYFFIPETKGKSLEDMDRIFGAPDAQKNDRESSMGDTRRVSTYDEDMKPEIEQHEFSEKQEEAVHHEYSIAMYEYVPLDKQDPIHLGWMKEALSMAEEAMEAHEVPVGCIFVREDKIIARARNRTNQLRNATRHAELEAIDEILASPSLTPTPVPRYPLSQTDLYVTVEPCIMCASALRQLGLRATYFGAANERFGGCGSVLDVNERPSSTHPSYPASFGYLREECIMILRRFYMTENSNAPIPKTKAKRVLKTFISDPTGAKQSRSATPQ